jgi:hypothetical protein
MVRGENDWRSLGPIEKECVMREHCSVPTRLWQQHCSSRQGIHRTGICFAAGSAGGWPVVDWWRAGLSGGWLDQGCCSNQNPTRVSSRELLLMRSPYNLT